MLKGGYDIGVHAARAELKNCSKNGNCALKVDCENAFNSIKRNFFLELIAAWVPQLMPFAWLWYSNPSKVFSNEGIQFSSEEGAQQGDHIGNYAFSMVAKFIDDRLQELDFALKLFYVNDLLLIGNLDTLFRALKIIKELEDLTGIKINMGKTVLYCPTQEIYNKAKDMFQNSLTIKNTMNIEYLKCPIGDNDFFEGASARKVGRAQKNNSDPFKDALSS